MLWLNLLIGAGAIQGIVLAIFVLRVACVHAYPPLQWLSGFIGAYSLLVLTDVVLETRAIFEIPHFYQLFDFLILWIGPLCYFYVRGLVGLPPQSRARVALHFVPGLALMLLIVPGLLVGAAAKRQRIVEELSTTPQRSLDMFSIAVPLTVLGYLVWSIALILRYWRELESEYSNVDRYRMSWLFQLLAVCAVLWVFWMLSSVARVSGLNRVAQLGLAVGIYALGYRGLAQPRLWFAAHAFRPAAPRVAEQPAAKVEIAATYANANNARSLAPVSTSAKYAKAGLTEAELVSIGEKITTLMKADLIFIEPDLSLTELAERVGETPHAVSQTLNAHFKKSFFEYVNEARIAEVKRCFSDPAFAEQSILDIALASGFSSKSTFHATFKRLTGLTPSASRADISEKSGVERV
jgi:AraC-like DNA-binding protein